MNKKQQINANILDNIKKITINNVEFEWSFSMLSFYKLLTEFGYENEMVLMESLSKANAITMCEVFFVGILWDKDDIVDFKTFLKFIDYTDCLVEIKEFLELNLNEYLDIKKKQKNREMNL